MATELLLEQNLPYYEIPGSSIEQLMVEPNVSIIRAHHIHTLSGLFSEISSSGNGFYDAAYKWMDPIRLDPEQKLDLINDYARLVASSTYSGPDRTEYKSTEYYEEGAILDNYMQRFIPAAEALLDPKTKGFVVGPLLDDICVACPLHTRHCARRLGSEHNSDTWTMRTIKNILKDSENNDDPYLKLISNGTQKHKLMLKNGPIQKEVDVYYIEASAMRALLLMTFTELIDVRGRTKLSSKTPSEVTDFLHFEQSPWYPELTKMLYSQIIEPLNE